jgi:ATP-dependent DNA helicase RecG
MTKFQESETVELKKSTSELKEAVISIVAMLNKHQRGEVWFGVKNDGTVVGQGRFSQTGRAVQKDVIKRLTPTPYDFDKQAQVPLYLLLSDVIIKDARWHHNDCRRPVFQG